VDDELELVLLFKEALSQIHGVNVFAFTEPNLALQHFESNKSNYWTVISDFRMPGLTGIELLRKVKSIKPEVKTLLISAFEVSEMSEDCVDKFLQKPIHMTELVEVAPLITKTV
jgi:two-component SAPR family response regulator